MLIEFHKNHMLVCVLGLSVVSYKVLFFLLFSGFCIQFSNVVTSPMSLRGNWNSSGCSAGEEGVDPNMVKNTLTVAAS